MPTPKTLSWTMSAAQWAMKGQRLFSLRHWWWKLDHFTGTWISGDTWSFPLIKSQGLRYCLSLPLSLCLSQPTPIWHGSNEQPSSLVKWIRLYGKDPHSLLDLRGLNRLAEESEWSKRSFLKVGFSFSAKTTFVALQICDTANTTLTRHHSLVYYT